MAYSKNVFSFASAEIFASPTEINPLLTCRTLLSLSLSLRWSRLRSGKGLLGALGCAVVMTAANSVVLSKATFDGTPPPLDQLVLAAAMIATWTAAVEVSVPSPQKTLPCEGFPLAFDDNAALPVLGALGAAAVFRLLGLRECQLRPWLFA